MVWPLLWIKFLELQEHASCHSGWQPGSAYPTTLPVSGRCPTLWSSVQQPRAGQAQCRLAPRRSPFDPNEWIVFGDHQSCLILWEPCYDRGTESIGEFWSNFSTNGKRKRERKEADRHLNVSMYLSFRSFDKKVLLPVTSPISAESVKGYPRKAFSNMTARHPAEIHVVECWWKNLDGDFYSFSRCLWIKCWICGSLREKTRAGKQVVKQQRVYTKWALPGGKFCEWTSYTPVTARSGTFNKMLRGFLWRFHMTYFIEQLSHKSWERQRLDSFTTPMGSKTKMFFV